MSDFTITQWLKRIFSAQSLGVIIAVVALLISIRQCGHEFGGNLDVSCNTLKVHNNETKNIVIVTDIKSINADQFCPNFINTDKYTIRDFTLKHNIESKGIRLISTEFYNNHPISNTNTIYKYSENILPPHQMTEPPLSGFELTDNSAFCRIHSSATWDGAEEPFEFTVNAYIYYNAKDSNESFESWQKRSSQYIVNNTTLSNYDAIYITSDNSQREFNISIYQGAPLTTEVKGLPDGNTALEDEHNISDKIPTIRLDSLISITHKQYFFKYKHFEQEKHNNLFLVYVAKSGNNKSLAHVSYHDITYPYGDLAITTKKEYYISDFLGIASEDSLLSQHITINGLNFKNTHPTQYIGVSFKSKKNSWYSGIINPNSTVSWKSDADDSIEEIHYFTIKDEWINSVTNPDLRLQYTPTPTIIDKFMNCSVYILLFLYLLVGTTNKGWTFIETLFTSYIPYSKRLGAAIDALEISKESPWYYILYFLSIVIIIYLILLVLLFIYDIAMSFILN